MQADSRQKEAFWRRPEGVTGAIVLIALIAGGGYLLIQAMPFLISLAQNTLYLAGILLVLGTLTYIILDPNMRTLVSYMYRNIMRWLTAWFIDIDPIGMLKNYTDDLEKNLVRMQRQIHRLRGQMHSLREHIINNQKEIESNLDLADKAREKEDRSALILKSRKAGRLKDSNIRLEDLYRRMEQLYRVLTRMHEHSKIMLEDVRDQVRVKEQERKAIRASHTAMESAANIVSGDRDKRLMFDRALESIADDVGQKVGEMERFMKVSEHFMESIDLQKGVFEEKGLDMLEEWEQEGESLLLGEEKEKLLSQDKAVKKEETASSDSQKGSQYDTLFE